MWIGCWQAAARPPVCLVSGDVLYSVLGSVLGCALGGLFDDVEMGQYVALPAAAWGRRDTHVIFTWTASSDIFCALTRIAGVLVFGMHLVCVRSVDANATADL